MSYKIVADSSANLPGLEGVAYASVPLKIVTAEKEYVDDAGLDTVRMLKELAAYKGRSGTACPSVGEWLGAFGRAEISILPFAGLCSYYGEKGAVLAGFEDAGA